MTGRRCKVCGCSETQICLIPDASIPEGRRRCGWVFDDLCSNPACLKAEGWMIVSPGVAGQLEAERAGLKPLYRTRSTYQSEKLGALPPGVELIERRAS